MRHDRSQAAIARSAAKVARKKRLQIKNDKLADLDRSGLRPTLATKPKQRIPLESYIKELKQFPHAREYDVLSKFKLFTPNCIVQYQHKVCETKFQTTPKLFELQKGLCPRCHPSGNMSSETIKNNVIPG